MLEMFLCSNCTQTLHRFKCNIERNTTGLWFCSYACQRAYRKSHATAPTLTCPVCKVQFIVKPYRVKENIQLTCSLACKTILLGWGSQVVYCDWCGEEFRRKNAEIKPHNFCSRPCMGKWQSANIKGEKSPTWRGGYVPYYGADWRANRKHAKERDNHRCQICGEQEDLEVHHIKPVRLFTDKNQANELNNLITLCRNCHIKTDVFARWLFDKSRQQSEPTHPLQSDSTITRIYFNHSTSTS